MRYAVRMQQGGEEGIFMRIVRREVPAEILYEDDLALAFLDNGPTAPGHTLVIPKHPYRDIFDIPAEDLGAVMEAVRKMAPAVRDAVGASGVNINSNHGEAAGQEVPHLHIHIIPRHDKAEFELWSKQEYAPGEAAEVAARIRERTAR